LAVARRPRDRPLTWLALSGAACLLERIAEREAPADLSPEPEIVEVY
jgi:hypothetical protein